jgi:hypothetical protein
MIRALTYWMYLKNRHVYIIMFPNYVWAVLIVLVIIMIYGIIDAMREDQEEFERLVSIAEFIPKGMHPDTHPDIWKETFKQVYGRPPMGNKTSDAVKNTLLGTARGSVIGLLSGGVDGVIKYAIIQGIAAPTINHFTDSWVSNSPVIT